MLTCCTLSSALVVVRLLLSSVLSALLHDVFAPIRTHKASHPGMDPNRQYHNDGGAPGLSHDEWIAHAFGIQVTGQDHILHQNFVPFTSGPSPISPSVSSHPSQPWSNEATALSVQSASAPVAYHASPLIPQAHQNPEYYHTHHTSSVGQPQYDQAPHEQTNQLPFPVPLRRNTAASPTSSREVRSQLVSQEADWAQTPYPEGCDGQTSPTTHQPCASSPHSSSRYHMLEGTAPDFITYDDRRTAPPESDFATREHPQPKRQAGRFPGDLYTSQWVRGTGKQRQAWCGYCSAWLTLKDSTYWYHMHYAHGIMFSTGLPGEVPRELRMSTGGWEGLCGNCDNWIILGTGEKGKTTFFRHAYKCSRSPTRASSSHET